MINWHMIDTVLLDMDGTLLDLHFDNFFWLTHLPQRYAEAHCVDLATATTTLNKMINSREGTLQWYCLDHWSELVQMDIPELKREVLHKIQVRPYAEVFLQRLKKLGKKLVLITNSHRKGLDIKLEVTKIDKLLDIVISSHDFNTPKEDARFWHLLQEVEKFDPERTVFIDDTVRVLKSAQDYGIKHLVCINQPDSQKPPVKSELFTDICHFDEIMPE